MELEKQVGSLDSAKRLKELGVKQDSLFYYYPKPKVVENSGGKVIRDGYKILYGDSARVYGVDAKYSAFTVAELGEMLPVSVTIKDKWHKLISTHQDSSVKNYWYGGYGNDKDLELCYFYGILTEADCRAKMLIYLLENKIIIPKQLERI